MPRAVDLMHQLAGSTQAHECYSAHLLEYALAHELDAQYLPLVEELGARSLARASTKELALGVVASDAFRRRAAVDH